ncbi:hypothetical protein [Paraburkholderia sp. BL21I4N1]|uniref:hypothetical protein n=1 Tax=Paraburkholderia sp. BL21I4N1 TaxID=1938801 RepID=UPI0011B22EA9|nr:hypothetical protein [Paraburkholderia sp. BL21I4N1]
MANAKASFTGESSRTPDQKRRLAATLALLAVTARRVLRFADKFDGWTPTLGGCHQNVDRWVESHPGHKAVRGWLDVSFLATPAARRFTAHSVVADENGDLFDVTLGSSDLECSFILHPGSDDDFRYYALTPGEHSLEHAPSA